jgi:hypothetical protein
MAERAENGGAEDDAGGDFADGEGLVKEAPAEPAEGPGGGDNEHPLDEHQCEVALDGGGVHNLLLIAGQIQIWPGQGKNIQARLGPKFRETPHVLPNRNDSFKPQMNTDKHR